MTCVSPTPARIQKSAHDGTCGPRRPISALVEEVLRASRQKLERAHPGCHLQAAEATLTRLEGRNWGLGGGGGNGEVFNGAPGQRRRTHPHDLSSGKRRCVESPETEARCARIAGARVTDGATQGRGLFSRSRLQNRHARLEIADSRSRAPPRTRKAARQMIAAGSLASMRSRSPCGNGPE